MKQDLTVSKVNMAFSLILSVMCLTSPVLAKNQPQKTPPPEKLISQAPQLINSGDTLTLESCINIAFKNNPNISHANNLARVYQSRIGEAKAEYFPQLNLSTGYNRHNPIISASNSKGNNQYSGNVNLNQLIYDFGKTSARVKIQKLNLDSTNYDVDDVEVNTAYNVKMAYYQALSAKISKDIYTRTIKQNEQHLKQAKAFFEVGTKSKIDIINAQVSLSNSKLNYMTADNGYNTAIANLNNAMGMPNAPEYTIADTLTFKRPESISANKEEFVANKAGKGSSSSDTVLKTGVEKNDILESLTLKKYDLSLDEAIIKAFANRPDLKAVVTDESAAKESVNLAKKDYLPTLSGSANYEIGGQKFPLDENLSVGANINISVFNGFLTKNQVNEAKASLDVAASNIEILKQNIYLQVKEAYINLTQAEKKIPVAELIVKQARENYELANGRYNAGVGNSTEVQDAETNYDNAQLSYVLAFYDYNTARINLEKAMGLKKQ